MGLGARAVVAAVLCQACSGTEESAGSGRKYGYAWLDQGPDYANARAEFYTNASYELHGLTMVGNCPAVDFAGACEFRECGDSYGTSASAGELTVTADAVFPIPTSQIVGYAEHWDLALAPPGGSLLISATGSANGAPPFEQTLASPGQPSNVTLTGAGPVEPLTAHPTSRPLILTWSPPVVPGDGRMVATLKPDFSLVSIVCNVPPDAGTLSIPPHFLERARASSNSSFADLNCSVVTRARQEIGDWTIDVQISGINVPAFQVTLEAD